MASATPDRKPFRETQYAFAAYIRDPERHPAPVDVDKRRIDMYRELFLNNVQTFLSGNFPVLKRILGEERWDRLVRDFFARHRSQTPYFSEIPEEFLSYLMTEREGAADDPPFMLELAHYEWVELALAISTAEPPPASVAFPDDPLQCRVCLSDVAWPLAYRFPVHRLAPDYQPHEAPNLPTYLLVYRSTDDTVRFFECNPVTYRLLLLLQEAEPVPLRHYLLHIASELDHPNPDVVLSGGVATLRALAELGAVAAIRPTAS